jgi:hypothetical protein
VLYCKGHMYYNEFYNHMVNSIWLYIIVIEKWNLKLYVSTSYGGIGLELSTCLKSFWKPIKGFKKWRIFIKIATKHSIKFEILIRIMLHSHLISSVHENNTFAITIVFFYFPICHTSTHYTHYVDLHYLFTFHFFIYPHELYSR